MIRNLRLHVLGAPVKRELEAESLEDLLDSFAVPEGHELFVNSAVVSRDDVDEFQLRDGDTVIATPQIKGN